MSVKIIAKNKMKKKIEREKRTKKKNWGLVGK